MECLNILTCKSKNAYIIITGRNSGTTDVSPPSYLTHQSPSLYHDPKLSPVQKRGSASPSPSLASNTKDHIRNSLESGNIRGYNTGVQEITDIPDDYLNQSSVLKHLAKEVKVPSPNGTSKNSENLEALYKEAAMKYESCYDVDSNLPPPPEYPHWIEKCNMENMKLSKSQPDLSKVGLGKMGGDLMSFRRGVSVPRPKTKGREENESNKASEFGPSVEMIELLTKENSVLKQELENCYQKVSKTQKVTYKLQKLETN